METEDQKITTGSEGDSDKLVSGKDNPVIQVDENELKELVRDHVKDEIQKEIKFDKASLFTVFGIFASIVTFVSIEIQILKTLCDFWNVVGFSIFVLASLLTFILILDYIGRGWRNDFKFELKQFPWILTMFIILLFATGFISTSFSTKEIACKDEAIFRKYESNFLEKQLELEGMYNDRIQNLQSEINDNKKNVEDLKKSLGPLR